MAAKMGAAHAPDLEGLQQHLNPGGRLYCRTLGTDREEHNSNSVCRAGFGDAESEFDIAVFISACPADSPDSRSRNRHGSRFF